MILGIDSRDICCETWGVMLNSQNPSSFVGSRIQKGEITDQNRMNTSFFAVGDDENVIGLSDSGVMFVDIKTDRGVFRFAA